MNVNMDVYLGIYPDSSLFYGEQEIRKLQRALDILAKKLKEITGIDFTLDFEFDIVTDYVGGIISPDTVSREIAKKIDGLSVKIDDIEVLIYCEEEEDEE